MNRLNAVAIIQLLEAPIDDRRPIGHRISTEANVAEIIEALRMSTAPLVRQILCDILGERGDEGAVDILINALQDASVGVRSSAADALAKIGDSRAGEALMGRLKVERSAGVRQMIAAALGAVGYRPAVPKLVLMLKEASATTRGCAAWSLGTLRSKEAGRALEQALNVEANSYAANRMKEAIEMIKTSD